MLFNTVQFAVFFLVVVATYFVLPHRWRLFFLLAASYYFYMCWSVKYILVILGITLVDYFAGIQIERASGSRRRLFLGLSILCNFGLLFAFKYVDFVAGNLNLFLQHFNFFSQIPLLSWILPVGISFHTFQAVSYTIEVYRGDVPAERNLLRYALYVAFFPQMVAGPIERPNNLLPQFADRHGLEYVRVSSGFRLILWGLIKKTVVADLASPVVGAVYANPRQFSGGLLLFASFLFAIQIYCDFSGYSDIAIGTARIMGFDLMINFRQPYFSKSISELWSRYHISLSTWFRDYLYIPMTAGGETGGLSNWRLNLLIVFLVSGLWHGANWTFVAWGGVHGVYIVAGYWTKSARRRLATISGISRLPRLWATERVVMTFLLVMIADVFFRAKSLGDAAYVLTHLWRFKGFQAVQLFGVGLPRFEVVLLLSAIPLLFLCEFLYLNPPARLGAVWRRSRPMRWGVYAAGFYSVVFFGVFKHIEFIYFQF